jgi:expansin (peptidoglycan-binding protein)
VEIVDMCPGCTSSQIDLSTAAFGSIQAQSLGTARVGYQVARDPALPGLLAVRVEPGSNPGSLAIQILNHGNPLSGVQVNGRPLRLRPDGYWIAGNGAGRGPYTIRVPDAAGNDAVLTGITLLPGALLQTGVLMYRPAAPGPSPQGPSPQTPVPSPGAGVQQGGTPAAPATSAVVASSRKC